MRLAVNIEAISHCGQHAFATKPVKRVFMGNLVKSDFWIYVKIRKLFDRFSGDLAIYEIGRASCRERV